MFTFQFISLLATVDEHVVFSDWTDQIKEKRHEVQSFPQVSVSNADLGENGSCVSDLIDSQGSGPPLRSIVLTNFSMPNCKWIELLQFLTICNYLTIVRLTGIVLGELGFHLACSIKCWGDTPHLRELSLDRFIIPEEIWSELFQSLSGCKQLTELHLSRNTVGESGYQLAQVIRSWGKNPSLQQLTLQNCSLAEQVCAEVLQSLVTCRNLKYLDLTNNTLGESGHHLAQVIRSWGSDPHLQELGLHNCSLPEQVCTEVLQSLATCRNLAYLNLTNNTLGESGHHLAQVIRSWGNDPPLQQLGLGNCSLPEHVCADILQSLSNCRKLEVLLLNDNTLSQSGHHLVQVIRSWGNDPPLKLLGLNYCVLPQKVCTEVLQSLTTCRNLTHLTLNNNTLGESGHHLAQVIRSWGNDPPLKLLGLHNCSLPEQVCAEVLQSLVTCRKLKYLDLTNNTLGESGHHLAQVIRSWGSDPHLQELGLHNCSLPEQVCTEVLQSLATCRNLAYLNLTNNTLGESGHHLAQVIRSWGNDPPLQQLGLGNCSLPEHVCADILQSLSNCRKLEVLLLNDNTLSQSGHHLVQVIRSWGNDPPLKLLGLNYCVLPQKVCTEVLQSLTTCRNLTHLTLNNNTLGESGHHLAQVIRSWGNDPPLKLLGLHNCSLPEQVCAEVLQSLATCRNLTYLDLSNNTLGESGHHLAQAIRSRGNNPPLKQLTLDNCSLPEEVCAEILQSLSIFRNLIHLNLGKNTLGKSGRHLVESIRSWGDDPLLEDLFLEMTAIREDVWAELLQLLSTCKGLTYINLCANVLTGCLPFLMRHSGLPSLETLGLNSAGLSKDDVNYLTNLIQRQMISGLRNLHLEGNNLLEMQIELADLAYACEKQMGLTLHLGIKTSAASVPAAKFTKIHSEQKIEKVRAVNQHVQVILN